MGISRLSRTRVNIFLVFDRAQPEKGPWKVNLLDYVYEAFMESCARRDLRHNIWKAYSQVSCHLSTNPAFTTFKDIEDIRETR